VRELAGAEISKDRITEECLRSLTLGDLERTEAVAS
jgi:hypothetical protein